MKMKRGEVKKYCKSKVRGRGIWGYFFSEEV
jgi:hypothetical protein